MFRAVPERNLWGALHPVWRLLALRRVLHGNVVKIVASVCSTVGKFATIQYEFSFPHAASEGPRFSEASDMSTEAEVRHMRRRKHAVITRRLVPLSGQEPGPVDFGSHERSIVMLEQAFDDGNGDFN